MKESYRFFIKNKKNQKIIGIIADQNPVINDKKQNGFLSLTKKYQFFWSRKLSKKIKLSCFICNMQFNNGKYTISFEVLSENPNDNSTGEITTKYFKLLENKLNYNQKDGYGHTEDGDIQNKISNCIVKLEW